MASDQGDQNDNGEVADPNIRIEVFWKMHQGLPKQGPGSDASTRRALAALGPLPEQPRILDLGCGPGRQSVVLAQETGGTVSAVDLIGPFLKQADGRAAAAGLSDRIETRQASMSDLPDGDESCDLIWSEGAIYNIGFLEGLKAWRRLVRSGGFVAVTELTWLVESPPADVRDFWAGNYPGIELRSVKERQVEEAGYRLLESFVLPENEWWDDYYSIIETRLEGVRKERSDAAWQEQISAFDEELRIVHEGLGSFGYVFYIMQKK